MRLIEYNILKIFRNMALSYKMVSDPGARLILDSDGSEGYVANNRLFLL